MGAAEQHKDDISTSVNLDHPLSKFFETLLLRCASTLQSLSWQHQEFWLRGPLRMSLGDPPPSFPLLRYLQLKYVCLHPRTLSSLLSSPLRHLELPTSAFNRLGECLDACELRDLQSLVISMLPSKSDECTYVANFVKKHDHLQKLWAHERDLANSEKSRLDHLIIPVLAEGSFGKLRCLSLAWGGEGVNDMTRPHEVHIPEAALSTIGTIGTLEQLSLRAGNEFGWRNQWLVDHDQLCQHLRNLSRLKMLALGRDTYPISPSGHVSVERYYALQLVGDSERNDARARADLDMLDMHGRSNTTDPVGEENEAEESEAEADIWERAHRNRMLKQAEAYAVVFPVLEWVLCGQRPIGFQLDIDNHIASRKALPLTQQRDECYTFLNKNFGILQ